MDGLDFESFLWIGMTDAVFLWLGKTPCEKQRSNSLLSGLASSALHSFKTLAGISSGLLASSGCRFLRSFLMSLGSKIYPFLGVCCWSLNFTSGILCIVELDFPDRVLTVFHHFLLLRLLSESSLFSLLLYLLLVIFSAWLNSFLAFANLSLFVGVLLLKFPEQSTLFGCCPPAVVIKPYLVSGFLWHKLPRYVYLHCISYDVGHIGAYIFWVFGLEGTGPVCWCEKASHTPIVSLIILPHFALVRFISVL